MKNSKRKLRGMTLIECIIAIAIVALATMVLAMFGNVVEANIKHSREMNTKVAVEGPIAEAQDTEGAHLVDNGVKIKVAKAVITTDESTGEVSKSFPTSGTIEINAKKFKVNPDQELLPKDDEGNYQVNAAADDGNLNLQFLEVEIPTVPSGD